MKGILNGVRVVDLTRYISGPFCGMLLADMGAEVIKVEKPGEGEISRTVGPWKNDVSLFFVTCNRNKKSVTADIRKPEKAHCRVGRSSGELPSRNDGKNRTGL